MTLLQAKDKTAYENSSRDDLFYLEDGNAMVDIKRLNRAFGKIRESDYIFICPETTPMSIYNHPALNDMTDAQKIAFAEEYVKQLGELDEYMLEKYGKNYIENSYYADDNSALKEYLVLSSPDLARYYLSLDERKKALELYKNDLTGQQAKQYLETILSEKDAFAALAFLWATDTAAMSNMTVDQWAELSNVMSNLYTETQRAAWDQADSIARQGHVPSRGGNSDIEADGMGGKKTGSGPLYDTTGVPDDVKSVIKNGSYDGLPTNAQNAYKGYESNGWKGNYNGQAAGTRAGSKYQNSDGLLPTVDSTGNSITYREFDINAPTPGVGRDAQRFVVGSDGSVYFTDSHYGQGVSPSGLPPFIKIE